MRPKKLIRHKMVAKLPAHEIEDITNKDELNRLFCLKIEEELEEIKASNYTDINEFADLLQVVLDFGLNNNISIPKLWVAKVDKSLEKGYFTTKVLNNLNINNPSNKIYYKQEL